MRTPLVLVSLCFLWYWVEVQAQTIPNVTFMEETLPNHVYINLTLVGSDASDSVQCRTDLGTCCRNVEGTHRGNWFPPDSELRLPFSSYTGADIYELRGPQQVSLYRRNDANMSSGIYRCDIATNAVHDDDDTTVGESVYVGLYASGGILKCTILLISDLHSIL